MQQQSVQHETTVQLDNSIASSVKIRMAHLARVLYSRAQMKFYVQKVVRFLPA
jgi:hypothetical protein